MSLIDISHPQISDLNQQVYQNLKQALWLKLRRQIFLAVCDDLGLRDSLVATLPTELTTLNSQGFTPSIKNQQQELIYLSLKLENQKTRKDRYPPLVTMDLNLQDPNPINQINQWLAKHPNPKKNKEFKLPIFQILGVENLTRQPPELQWSFLRNLREIESVLLNLELSLLLWVPRPWLNTIEHSAPEFWRCRSKVFEFEGEPTLPTQKSQKSQFKNNKNYPLQPPPPPPPPLRRVKTTKNKNLYPLPPLPLKVKELDGIRENRQNLKSSIPSLISSFKSPANINRNRWQINQDKFVFLVELVLATIAENLDKEQNSSENCLPLEILQALQKQLGNSKSEPQKIAVSFQKLGDFYRDRVSAGNVSPSNLAIGIHAYELLLQLTIDRPQNKNQSENNWTLGYLLNSQISLANNQFPLRDTLNDLGTLYWMLFRQPATETDGKKETLFYLERAIALYQIAASKIDKKTQAETYIRLQKNLGMALGDLARHREPPENLRRAVVAYQEAVLYCNPQANPQQYAATLNNLGAACWNLAQYGQPASHLLGAISAYSEALRYSKPEEEPLNYGMLQNNLATAYWNLSQIEGKVELLLKAIEAYKEALKYRTSERVPAACAATNNNLGTAYWHLAINNQADQTQEQLNYWQEAIAAYSRAVKLAKELSAHQLTFDILATHNNLGLAHYQLGTSQTICELKEAKCRSHLEAALENHLVAYTGWQKLFASPNFPSGKPKSESHQTALAYIVKTIRALYQKFGLEGQNFALSKLPGDLLPEILRRL